MKNNTIKRNYKDGIFRTLFNNEEKLLELYNALSGRNYSLGTPVKIVTLDNVIFNEIKNDVAFVIDDRFIILAEHQSTLSPNFPLRMFCYLGKEYEKLSYSEVVYSKRPVYIPTPELYVFYDGKEDSPEEWELKLSDSYKEKCGKIAVETVVKVYNVNYDKGAKLLEKCKTLQEYSMFMHMVRTKFIEIGELEIAVKESIRECIENNILAEYLMEQRGNIMSVLEVNLTLEERDAIREQDGYARGLEAGEVKSKRETAIKMKEKGFDYKTISELTGLTEEEIESL